MTTKKLYIIQDRNTKEYKTVGFGNTFSIFGKVWCGIGRVKSHFRLYGGSYYKGESLIERLKHVWGADRLDSCDVVEVELRVLDRKPVKEFIKKEMK